MNEKGLSTLYQEKNKGERDVRKQRKLFLLLFFTLLPRAFHRVHTIFLSHICFCPDNVVLSDRAPRKGRKLSHEQMALIVRAMATSVCVELPGTTTCVAAGSSTLSFSHACVVRYGCLVAVLCRLVVSSLLLREYLRAHSSCLLLKEPSNSVFISLFIHNRTY